MPRARKPASPFRYFNSSPEVIKLVLLMFVHFPLSLRNVDDLLLEGGATSAMRRCGLPVTSVGSGCRGCGAFGTGAGTSTRCT